MSVKEFFLGKPHPINNYDKCPFAAWLIITFVVLYGIFGCIIIFTV